MYVGYIDIINSFIQSIMFVCAVNYCISKEHKKNKLQIYMFVALYFLLITVNTFFLGNSSLSIILIHIQEILFFIIIYYKSDKLSAIIGFSIIYLLIGINSIICFAILVLITKFVNIDFVNANIIIMYLPQFALSYFILRNMNLIYKLYLIIKSRISSILILINFTLILDFSLSFSVIINGKDNPIFKEIIFILLAGFLILITIYFNNINKKANEIYLLNGELEKKINELKKIKHDYGSQISYLYGAYLMNDYEKLGKLLKDIINGQDISLEIKVLTSEDSIISRVINTTNLKEVNLLIDEKANLNETNIKEMDLQKIISNIVRNSVDVLNGKGLLMIKTYYSYNSIILLIQNNGPKINSNIIDKIFEQGFSTKKNNVGDNGFGLYIVKELVNKYNGSIIVESDDDKTSFIIKLPLK